MLQNSTLAITISLTILNNNEMAIILGLYGLWMLFTGFAFALWMLRGVPAEDEELDEEMLSPV